MKAVLDTNSLVSALLIPPGPSGQIVLRWYARELELAISPDTLTERMMFCVGVTFARSTLSVSRTLKGT